MIWNIYFVLLYLTHPSAYLAHGMQFHRNLTIKSYGDDHRWSMLRWNFCSLHHLLFHFSSSYSQRVEFIDVVLYDMIFRKNVDFFSRKMNVVLAKYKYKGKNKSISKIKANKVCYYHNVSNIYCLSKQLEILPTTSEHFLIDQLSRTAPL